MAGTGNSRTSKTTNKRTNGSGRSASSKGRSSTSARSASRRTASGNTRGGSRSRRNNTVSPEPMDDKLVDELIIFGIFAICAAAVAANFGWLGPIGDAISSVEFGLFGLPAYAAPLLIAFLILFAVVNSGSAAAFRKEVSGISLYAVISMFFELIADHAAEMEEKIDFLKIYKLCSEKHNGGGVFFGTLFHLSVKYLSTIGTVLLLLAIGLISLTVLTEKSLIGGVRKGGRRIAEAARDTNEARIRNQRFPENSRSENAHAEDTGHGSDYDEDDEGQFHFFSMLFGRRSERTSESAGRDRRSERKLKRQEKMEAEETDAILRMDRKSRGVVDVNLKKEIPHTDVYFEMREITIQDVENDREQGAASGMPDDSDFVSGSVDGKKLLEQAAPEAERGENVFGGHSFVTNYGNVTEIKRPADPVRIMRPENSDRIIECDAGDTSESQAEISLRRESTAEPAPKPDLSGIPVPRTGFTPENELPLSTEKKIVTSAKYAPGTFVENFDEEPSDDPADLLAAARRPLNQEIQSQISDREDLPNSHPEAENGHMPDSRGETEDNNEADSALHGGEQKPTPISKYRFPSVNLLNPPPQKTGADNRSELMETAAHLRETLQTFGVEVTVSDISQGPSVTRYEIQPKVGVKVSRIVGLADDIKLNLAATDIRIEAPIPGKSAVGIEVPNKENSMVSFRELLESDAYKKFESKLVFAVGKDIGGQTVVTDIAKMPHMLIAGSTGSGKSVCINTIIMSILYKANPEEVKLIMIDPKVVELSIYNGIPHLLIPVVTDPKKAAGALNWGVKEMTDRYQKFAEMGVRDLKGYNAKMEQLLSQGAPEAQPKLPQILIIVDELADLMMVAPGEVEESICRLAQLARAAGIHLIIATQRPSVDVITGLIKANMPSRVAFAVSSGVDSRTILDMNGAEKLLGKGDMLFAPQGYPKPARIQGAFISDDEIQNVVDFLKGQQFICSRAADMKQEIENASISSGAGGSAAAGNDSGSMYDEYFVKAGRFIIDKDRASIGMLQRVLKIGFNRAARIMDQLSEAGVVGPEDGTKPRKVLMSPEQFESFVDEFV